MEGWKRAVICIIIALPLIASARAAGPWHGGHGKHYDPPPHPRSPDRHRRAGCPQKVAHWAHCSYNTAYDGYYVGGGAVHRGDPPCFPADGVWGWDYFGRHFDRHVDLGWWHGRRYQAGGGKCNTDGPKLLHHE
jgi:hypothetical protein